MNKPGKLPPGSLGLPLLGETLHFLFSKGPIGTPQPFFAARLRRYGPISLTHMMGRPTVLSMDPELNKLLLANEEKLVHVYLPKYLQKVLGPLVCLQGPRHRAFRELAILGVNANAIQKLHLEPVQDFFWECLKSWQQTPSVVVEAMEPCREWAFIYSVKYYLGLEADDPVTTALMRDFFHLFHGVASIPINLPGTTFNKAFKAVNRIDSTLRRLIRERKFEGRKDEKDFLDYLLKRADGSGDHCNGLHIADLIFSFVLGAFENTAVLFGNVIKYLSENEHVIDELRRENLAIQKTKTNKEKLTWEDYQNMHFTRNVVKETLRLTSIAAFLFRLTREDVHFKGIVIPKGWMVLMDFSTAHLNSEYYPNPLRFDPWRWTEPTKNCLEVLTPFGGGPRRCPGGLIAQFEATILVHYFVTLFKWKRVYKGEKQCDERDCLSIPNIKGGLFLKIEPLQSEMS
ncbi:hypothetical protein GOP47_0021811 [Adiantum capillus-veneris]|uniref:Cytochrome P450 n=1 Tax=Adiantum capillus-veneris TaxID=13818 RepID=A0A9D4Z6K2_ADICA|nr:hypothetical protein GOP47_0021811 [Adiantum capillus-veneris]